MSDKSVGRVHGSFWVIGVVALIWNAMGVMNYLMQSNADALSAYPEAARALIENRPAWATGASLTGLIVMFAVAMREPALPSLAW